MTNCQERIQCPVCGHESRKLIYTRPYINDDNNCIHSYLHAFYNVSPDAIKALLLSDIFELARCRQCTLIYQTHIPNELLLRTLYCEWINQTKAFERYQSLPATYYANLAAELSLLTGYFKNPLETLKFLDFGMGWGQWARMCRAFGVDCLGCELNTNQIEYACSQGITNIQLDRLPENHFDFINTEQVFEHLTHPREIMHALVAAIKPGGLIKISVPFVFDINERLTRMDWKRYRGVKPELNPVAPLEHLQYFTRKSLCELAEQNNLKACNKLHLQAYSTGAAFDMRGGLHAFGKRFLKPLYRYAIANHMIFQKPK
jgi:2-polyprenyl-3-methyl-5-hydroxy-6-metoxy-1,4-benzoquinol methylase